MNNRTCPHDKDQDGVCGCPDFWRNAKGSTSNSTSRSTINPLTRTTKDTNNLRSPSPTPPGGLKQTCFFWYHGECRRGNDCQWEHRTHITWPIVPPPGYVHFKPCVLPFCPLNSNMVALNEQNAKKRKDVGLGGQVDGAFMSRATTVQADNDSEEDAWQQHTAVTVNTGSSSECSDAAEEFHDAEEAVAVTAITEQEGAGQGIAASSSPTPVGELEDFDMSGIASPPPASEVDTERIVSLSRPGTIAKRYRTSRSPVTQRKRPNREPSPRQEPFDPPKGPRTLIKETTAPKHAPDICFFYYHYGDCKPKSRGGRPVVCKFSHTDPVPGSKVSRPHSINHSADCSLPLCPVRMAHQDWRRNNAWKPSGSTMPNLKFEPQEADNPGLGMDAEPMIKEQRTPVKYDPDFFEAPYSSSPRDAITAARRMSTRGPTFNKHDRSFRTLQLPKITCPARERYKEQKSWIEKRQAENGIPLDNKDAKLLNQKQGRALKNEMKRQKRMKRREHEKVTAISGESRAGSTVGGDIRDRRGPSRDAGVHRTDFKSVILSPDMVASPDAMKYDGFPTTTTKRAKRKGSLRYPLRSQRARSLFQNDLANGGAVETFDPEAEFYRQGLRLISGFPESTIRREIRDEREARSTDAVAAMEDVQTVRRSQGTSDAPMNASSATEDKQHAEKAHALTVAEGYKVLVDYELPMGDDRLDWDTDLVRRTFGEIE